MNNIFLILDDISKFYNRNSPIATSKFFKNTLDKYDGDWYSCHFYGKNLYSKEISDSTYFREYKKLLDTIEEYNNYQHRECIIAGVELNYMFDCICHPHIDDVNYDERRQRIIYHSKGNPLHIQTNGEEHVLCAGDSIFLDCIKIHSAHCEGECFFILADLLPKESTNIDILKYLMAPMLYYMEKQDERYKRGN